MKLTKSEKSKSFTNLILDPSRPRLLTYCRIDNLQSKAGQRENLLKQFSPDSYKAYVWIRENAARFEKPVFGPPIIECSVKDHKYVDIIEGLVRGSATVGGLFRSLSLS